MSKYQDFKYYQRKEKEYADKKRAARDFIQKGDKGWPSRYFLDLGQTFLEFLRNFEGGKYEWTGEDADACYNKMKALREEQNQTDHNGCEYWIQYQMPAPDCGFLSGEQAYSVRPL